MSRFREDMRVSVNRAFGPEAVSLRVAEIARNERDRLIREGKAAPRYRTTVDGIRGASENTVKRIITYDFDAMGDAVRYALDYLAARSPRLTGRFASSFMVSVNGAPVRAESFDPLRVPLGAEIIIYNRQPYGRKVDTQFVGKRALKFSAPPGLYADAALAVRRRFGNSTAARRVYNINVPEAWVTKAGVTVQYPALILNGVG